MGLAARGFALVARLAKETVSQTSISGVLIRGFGLSVSWEDRGMCCDGSVVGGVEGLGASYETCIVGYAL